MRMTKKITSIVLAVLMVVSMVSVMAVSVSAAAYVAEVNGTPYETLQAAIDAAQDGDTVELTADITLNPQNISGESAKFGAYITKSITIDGKNHTVTSGSGTARTFGVKGVSGDVDVVFKNITINNSQNKAICIITRGGIGSLSLDNVKLDTQGCSSGYNQPLTIGGTQYTQAKVDVKNSTIQTNNEASKYYAIILWNPVDLTIKDSTIKGWACVYQKPFEDGTTDKTEVTIDNSTLVSKGLSGSSNHFAAIMTEESDFSCNVTNSTIDVTAADNTYQGVVASNGVSGFDVELGTGNDVTMTGDTAIIGYNFDPDNHEIAVSGGTFNKPVDEYYCAENYDPVVNGDGTYGVGIETNPLNPFMITAADAKAIDDNKFGLSCDYLKGTLLGVQKKEDLNTNEKVPGSDKTSESNQEGAKNIRFVAVIDTDLIRNLGPDDDYGFVLAKVDSNHGYSNTGIENLKANWGNGEKTISAKDTFNNVCGTTDEALAYGNPNANTPYKYVTCAVNDIEDDSKIVARFYYKKDGVTHYAKYAGHNYQYTGCISTANATS